MDDLEIVYLLRGRITRLENRLKNLTCENVQNNSITNKKTVAKKSRIEAKLTKLKGIHNDKIYDVYSGLTRRTKSASILNNIQMKIIKIDIEDNRTKLKLTPSSFKLDEKKSSLKDLIYPTDGTDRYLINLISRYRTIVNKSKDFSKERLEVNTNSLETILIGLDLFIRQYDGEITFTDQEISYENSIEDLVCGIAHLGNIHLVVSNLVPTAKFSIKFHLNYDRDLTETSLQINQFLLDFNKSIARLLQCKTEFIRIFSIERIDSKRGMIKLSFGLTTPDKDQTISLAKHFQNLVRRSDFRNDRVLQYIQNDNYRYDLVTIISYLQISSKDFDINNNYDYQLIDSTKKEKYGNYTFYPPIGCFRHALDLQNKYNEQNNDQQWPIAYYGTDMKRIFDNEENIHIGIKDRKSSIYVTDHSNGLANLYTNSFTISNGDNNQTFKIIFQCRVKPQAFTSIEGFTQTEQLWQIFDPQAIHPYGLLLQHQMIS